MKAVLDTNIVVSNFIGAGPSKKVLDLWRKGEMILVLSQDIYLEYLRVLERFKIAPHDMQNFATLLLDPERTEFVSPEKHFHVIREDPTDDKFLDCGVAGNADAIVSGDKHLYTLQTFEGIPILKPREFLNKFFLGI